MKSIAAQIKEIAERSNQKTETVVRQTIFRLGQAVVLKTPVDTGLAKANWLHGINSFTPEQIDKVDKSGGIAISDLLAGVKEFNLGGEFYFVNSLPYIKKLEEGSSLQAPTGMLKLSIEELPMILDQEIKRLK